VIITTFFKKTLFIVRYFNVINEAKLVINFISVSVTYAFGNMRQNKQKERQQSEKKEEKGYQLIEETVGITE
jgi:tonB dependent receptor